MDHVARMRDAGVVMVAGSDSAWANYPMGDFQTEIEAHVMAGMSNMEAIISATRDSAMSCRVDDTVGTLEVWQASRRISRRWRSHPRTSPTSAKSATSS